MLRFCAPTLMRQAPSAMAARRGAMAATASSLYLRQQATAFSTRGFNFGAVASSAAVSAPTATAGGLTSSSAVVKEQRMSFVSGTRGWLARNRGGSAAPAGASESVWGSVVQNNTPATGGSDSGPASEVLTPAVRDHLMKVYNLLAITIGAASLGSAAMIMTPLGKMVPFWLPMVGGFVPLLWLWFKPPANPVARQALVVSFGLLQGMGIAPIVKATAASGVLGAALVMTGAVFCGFSAAAFMAPRASLVAFQGPLMGMFFGMFAISILNMFWPTAFAHSIILYGGLAIFSAFIAVDTQVMIERARCGEGDVAMDSLNMFINVIQVFIRIAQILRGMTE